MRNSQEKFVSAPPGIARVKKSILRHFCCAGDLEGRSGSFSSFSLCFKGDD